MKRMKEVLSVLLLCISLIACSDNHDPESQTETPEPGIELPQEPVPESTTDESSSRYKIKKVFKNDDVRDLSAFTNGAGEHAENHTFEDGEYSPEDIQTLRFNEGTVFKGSEALADEILENGKNPGLGIRRLHEQGITGNGVNIAIIDANLFLNHPEFEGKITEYFDTGVSDTGIGSMHGPAVTSILVGTEIGTAPDARVYYVAREVGRSDDSQDVADGLYWIIEQNRSLPDGQKIRVVSISDDPAEFEGPGREAYLEARDAAEAEGVLVIDANSFVGPAYYDYHDDPEDVKSYKSGYPTLGPQPLSAERIAAPASVRTMAEHYMEDSPSYAYYGNGGVSLAIPYAAGVLALGWQVNPELDQDEIVELLFQTAYVNGDGANIIHPSSFINAVKETIE